MVIEFRKYNANSSILACSQVTSHDIRFVVEALGAISN